MKRNRILLLILWILSLIGISLRGGPITYELFFLLTLLPMFSLLYCGLVIFLFKIFQNVEGISLTANHPAVFHFTLGNESPVLFAGIRVLFYSSFSSIRGLSDTVEYELHPHSELRRTTTIVCRYRGEYEIGIKAIMVRDFLNLFTLTFRNREPLKLKIRPDIIHLDHLKEASFPRESAADTPVSPSEADVLVREYVPGDDPRLISWKVSGAQGRLMVRQRIQEQRQGVMILLDPHRYHEAMEDYLPLENRMLETVIALSLYLSEQGIPVEADIYGPSFERWTLSRSGGFDAFYERLCGYAFRNDRTMKLLTEEAMHSSRILSSRAVFLVLHAWDDDTALFVERLMQNQIEVTVCLISEEETQLPVTRAAVHRIRLSDDLKEVL